MNTIDLSELQDFIIHAKRSTYVGKGQHLLPYRLCSYDLQYTEGDWAYHDSYLGESDFIGEEIVYLRGKVAWGMNYFGRILLPDQITSAQAGAVIQRSLTAMYTENRFLGGFTHTYGEFTYHDTSSGDVAFFTGREEISKGALVVYELVYHGGVVKG